MAYKQLMKFQTCLPSNLGGNGDSFSRKIYDLKFLFIFSEISKIIAFFKKFISEVKLILQNHESFYHPQPWMSSFFA